MEQCPIVIVKQKLSPLETAILRLHNRLLLQVNCRNLQPFSLLERPANAAAEWELQAVRAVNAEMVVSFL